MTLQERIENELKKTDVAYLSSLLRYMREEKGFYWVRSSGHDRWTNGTAQHSWRTYQYMRYMREHPEAIPSNRPNAKHPDPMLCADKVKKLTDYELILTGLLHDVGKIDGCSHHATNSKRILTKYFGASFVEHYPQIIAAIWCHHNADHKHDRRLDPYKNSTLKRLLNRADSMAAGTTWNSTRFKNGRSQRGESNTYLVTRIGEALDRTIQVNNYGFYLDNHYNLEELPPYNTQDIVWDGTTKSGDYIEVHMSDKQNLLIRTNLVKALFYYKSNENHHYIVSDVLNSYQNRWNQALAKGGIFLPHVCFFRGTQDEGYPMIKPYYKDVKIIP